MRILRIHQHRPQQRLYNEVYETPNLDPPTRIDIVMLAWLHQGIYGKMTQIAQAYQISRTFLYQLLLAANLQLEVLFRDEKLLFEKIIST